MCVPWGGPFCPLLPAFVKIRCGWALKQALYFFMLKNIKAHQWLRRKIMFLSSSLLFYEVHQRKKEEREGRREIGREGGRKGEGERKRERLCISLQGLP